ncbi:MAG: hypothetical protein ABIH67_02755 [Candidatus Uhrbacteria bacterium]
MKPYLKHITLVSLYLVAFLTFCFSVYYFTERSLVGAFVALLIFMSIYTLMVVKDIKFFSPLAYFSLLVTAFFTFAVSANQVDGRFLSVKDEQSFLLTLAVILVFVLFNSLCWVQTKKGWKKIVGLIFTILSVLALLLFGTSSPNYFQNFIYTRIFILLLLILSIYSIFKKKTLIRIFGILGVIISVSALFLGAALFIAQTYQLDEQEQQEVIAFLDPKINEMFDYYNQEDYENFCKYCGTDLQMMNNSNPMINNKETLGDFEYFGQPQIKYEASFYYVEYPVKFTKSDTLYYLTFLLQDISADGTIYGFSISETPATP